MDFKAYDIISTLVPGFILLIGLLTFLDLGYDNNIIVVYTVLAYVIGYIANTIGSWLEDIYFLSWGGKPSTSLLKGKNIWKVKIYNIDALKNHLALRTTNPNPTEDELFSIAMRNANGTQESRVSDFNAMYAFSRTLLTSVLIGGILILIKNYSDWKFYITILPVIFVLWLRCKQKGYYYAKEVLEVYRKMYQL